MLNSKDKAAENNTAASSQGSNNVYGKLDSPVTLTEFVDFQCEACYAYYPYVKQLKEQYKDRVKFQVRNFPLTSGHQFAMQAARSAEAAARQGKFWEMHDKLFEGQKVWERTQDPTSYFNEYAQSIGLDMTKFEADRKSSDVNAVVSKDLKDVQDLGGTGTPTFVLNGKKIESPGPSLEALSKVLDDALKQAE
jgi:protein-disulfide isomerase